jgi:hypothetical protein
MKYGCTKMGDLTSAGIIVHELWVNYFGGLHEQQRALNKYRGPGFSLPYILASSPITPSLLSASCLSFSHCKKRENR